MPEDLVRLLRLERDDESLISYLLEGGGVGKDDNLNEITIWLLIPQLVWIKSKDLNVLSSILYSFIKPEKQLSDWRKNSSWNSETKIYEGCFLIGDSKNPERSCI